MARCESAFEGVLLDRFTKGGRPFMGSTEPHEIWEEEMQLLSRSVDQARHGAPVLAEMARRRVCQVLGRILLGASLSDDEAVEEGMRRWALDASMTDKAKAI